MKTKVILVGAGGHCHSCIDVIESTNNYTIMGILDTNIPKGEKVFDYEILGNDADAKSYLEPGVCFFLSIGAIGNSILREKLFKQFLELGFKPTTIISPTAYVSQRAKIGDGSLIGHGAIINSGAVIGENCIINTKALVEHDSSIQAHSHISTAAIINGSCKIGAGSFIGSNATVVQSTVLQTRSFIKANSLYKGNE